MTSDRPRRECTHPRAHHQHGTYLAYKKDLCRCEPCSRAASREDKRIALNTLTGGHSYVDAGPARRHVRALLTVLTVGQIQARSGVNRTAIRGLIGDLPHKPQARRITRATHNALMAVRATRIGPETAGLVDGTGTRRRLCALTAIGWDSATVCRRLGWADSTHRLIINHPERRITVRARNQVDTLYRQLADTPPPPSLGATKARRRALRRGWPPPAAWDDDTIDDPAIGPLGLAPDAHPATIAFALGKRAEDVAAVLGVSESTVRKLAGRHQAPRGGLDTLVEDWHDTWDYHLGDMPVAAARLGMTQDALHKQLCRAQRAGLHVRRAEVAA